jgi:hypothetical protein
MIDDECGAVGGMRIAVGNRSTRGKRAPVPLCAPQIPHYLTWARTRATVVRSRRLTAWAMARPQLWGSLRSVLLCSCRYDSRTARHCPHSQHLRAYAESPRVARLTWLRDTWSASHQSILKALWIASSFPLLTPQAFTVGVAATEQHLSAKCAGSQGLHLYTEQHKQASMPRVGLETTIPGFEPTIPGFKRAKTARPLW